MTVNSSDAKKWMKWHVSLGLVWWHDDDDDDDSEYKHMHQFAHLLIHIASDKNELKD